MNSHSLQANDKENGSAVGRVLFTPGRRFHCVFNGGEARGSLAGRITSTPRCPNIVATLESRGTKCAGSRTTGRRYNEQEKLKKNSHKSGQPSKKPYRVLNALDEHVPHNSGALSCATFIVMPV